MTTHFWIALALSLAACESMPSGVSMPEAPPTPTTPASPAPPTADALPAAPSAPTVRMPDLGQLLRSITDGPTAAAAIGPLDAGLAQLQPLLAGVPEQRATQTGAGAAGAGNADTVVGDLLRRFGLDAGSPELVDTLLAAPAVKAAAGPSLERLQGLLAKPRSPQD